MRDWVTFARDAGFALVMVSDHVAVTPDVAELYPPPFYDPFTTLAWMAGYADGIELGTTVTILPYRHPLLTAPMAAALDEFTGGRFVLGVAAGWAGDEFAALGLPFEARGRMSEEYLAAIRSALRDEVVSADGTFVCYRDVATGPSRHPRSGWAVRRTRCSAGPPGTATPGTRTTRRSTGSATSDCPGSGSHSPHTVFCPRMRARVVGHDLPAGRAAGVGSLAQVVAQLPGARSTSAPSTSCWTPTRTTRGPAPRRGGPAGTGRDRRRAAGVTVTARFALPRAATPVAAGAG